MNPAVLYSGTTMGGMIAIALGRHPNRIAFIDGARQITYAELARRIGCAMALFEQLGLKRGDVVAQLSANRYEVYAVIAAAYMMGLTSTTLHAMASEEDQRFILEDSGAKIFIADPAYAERAAALRSRVTAIRHWYSHESTPRLRAFWEEADSLTPRPLIPASEPEDIIRLAYTGGTTGTPKGVMLSNRSLVANTTLALAGMEWPEEVRFICPTPISHGAGSLILPTLWRGGCFILQRKFDAGEFLQGIEQHRATMTFLVPTMLYALLDHPKVREVDHSSMHTILYGAAPMAPARIREALEVFGPVLVQGYGQTEAPNTVLTLTRREHLEGGERGLESAGRPYPGVEVRLLRADGSEAATGEPGEICVRGPLVMSGYWNRPAETAEALRGDWLHTGDVAIKDEDGFFYLVDRQKDMIISGGFNVFPAEVERVLAEHPAVAAAAVLGVPDDKWGEAVKAVVVKRNGAQVGADELIAMVRARKGVVYAPKSVDFVDALPLTALGKPDKKALRARYWGNARRAIN